MDADKPNTRGPRRARRRRPARGKQRKASEKPARASAGQSLPKLAASTAPKPADLPLTPGEVAELKKHFRFLAKHRRILRLKLNAAEDLLVNGVKDPTHRGVCQHLLAKIDRSSTEKALARLTEPTAELALLEGIVQFSSDVSILLLYLERLTTAASRPQAAAALSAGLLRIDFSAISAGHMRRLLDLVGAVFGSQDRPMILFGLLSSPSFCQAFDTSIGGLPAELADLFIPLRAAHAVVVEGNPSVSDSRTLGRGVDLMLSVATDLLQTYPDTVRARLAETSIQVSQSPALVDDSIDKLLAGLDPNSRTYSRVATARARQLLARQQDDRARALLQQLKEKQPGYHLPIRWLAALDAPRLGRVALVDAKTDNATNSDAFQRGMWLDRQKPVWVRVASDPTEATALSDALVLHQRLAIPGVAPIVVQGATPDGRVFAAFPLFGQPSAQFMQRKAPTLDASARLALDGVLILGTLAAVGFKLPDMSGQRLLISGEGRLWIADLVGAVTAPPDEIKGPHLQMARAWCNACLQRVEPNYIAQIIIEAIPHARDGLELASLLTQWS